MNVLITTLVVLSIAIIAIVILLFVVRIMYNRSLRKDKYDLLKYLIEHKSRISINIKENGKDTLSINTHQTFPLASTVKIVIAYCLVKQVNNGETDLNDEVKLSDVDCLYIPNTDGGAHIQWKESIDFPEYVSLLDIAKGMMKFSSNACTDFLINRIGLDKINNSIEILQMHKHSKLNYLTPTLLIPGYLSNKRKIAWEKLNSMNNDVYHKISKDIFQHMKTSNVNQLKQHAPKMLNKKMQLLINNRLPSSTTKEYCDLLYRIGNDLLNKKEKKLFSDIVLGESTKQGNDRYFWYKGGATLFVLTSALYRETQDSNISVSLFIQDNKSEDLYWIRGIFNQFILNVAKDDQFRERVKTELSMSTH
ncbi:D-alanyl-D-alanine carboxypeptidase [Gracilibacillus halophilus YIM-C55.5]|uniref:D-alanyl-D-alanine carboxypeptidase n=1 Tax=Gracilibacillus halophilus YIM-C55.5 TaxID=1308866 RepID=N4WAS2_9BACI|nr:serine hydrolase [Gracilibacillus halophilus]ENH96364.1 D-alanyl-D-alanine carboxypeptidase [Gracilibacillus halophilus YIM-C55.5]